jgi:hypothetical protein
MKILQNVVPSMNSQSRIIIMDGVVPEVGTVPYTILKNSMAFDLQMMAALNAKERKAEDWKAWVKSADERLTVKAIRQPVGSAASLLEVVLES